MKRIVALAMCVVAYWCTRLPALTNQAARDLSQDFAFTQLPLLEPPTPHRTERLVDPRLSHISGWISSLGASVALGDLDGDGLPNDICLVDPRTDEVWIFPVPGTEKKPEDENVPRYRPFNLTFHRELYDSPKLRQHLPETMAPMGSRIGDLDEDGFLDVLVYFWGRPPIVFLARRRSGRESIARATYRAVEVAPSGTGWYTNAVTFADLDGDGHIDILIGNYDRDDTTKMGSGGDVSESMQHSMSRAFNGGRNRFLLWQKPNQASDAPIQFVDVDVGLPPEILEGWTLAAGAADLNLDYLPEVYFANDFGPDRLLYNVSTPGHLRFQVLNGEKDFTTPNSKVLGRDSFKGMGVDFGYLNQTDNIPDILVSNIAGSMSLEESHFAFVNSRADKDAMTTLMRDRKIAPYRDESESRGLSRSGWGWDIRFGDFNNDSVPEVVQGTGFLKGAESRADSNDRWPELHEVAMGNDELLSDPGNWPRFRAGDHDELSGHEHNPFFVRAADGRYYDLARRLGLDAPHVTRGIATADCDGDGDLDFAIANQWERSWYFRNDLIPPAESPRSSRGAVSPRPSLILNLLLPTETHDFRELTVLSGSQPAGIGSPAIGATACIGFVRDAAGNLQGADGTIVAGQVDGGSGHSGQRSPQLHFGLHNSQAFPDPNRLLVDLRWRDRAGRKCHARLKEPLMSGTYTVILVAESLPTEL